eukprot:1476878-Prorocentrum_lima.AAC.1
MLPRVDLFRRSGVPEDTHRPALVWTVDLDLEESFVVVSEETVSGTTGVSLVLRGGGECGGTAPGRVQPVGDADRAG